MVCRRRRAGASDIDAEGLVIKAARSLYNDHRRGMQWIKLKKDYIPHHGDTVSMCIVAAGFDKDRARQLLGL